ncbi:Hypothetical_protein [Hexamita inflata]|uniref:Hypothetical_protein n=1 Tax=Hexamita inflata TaxID=28002 RepID=A0AA86R0A7_9EUKA|nr:Hypothetical protein HINF_LOCUS51622 [Hexamita inflata]
MLLLQKALQQCISTLDSNTITDTCPSKTKCSGFGFQPQSVQQFIQQYSQQLDTANTQFCSIFNPSEQALCAQSCKAGCKQQFASFTRQVQIINETNYYHPYSKTILYDSYVYCPEGVNANLIIIIVISIVAGICGIIIIALIIKRLIRMHTAPGSKQPKRIKLPIASYQYV